MKTDLFIIIVTYNGIKWLSKCLNSCVAHKVIVVDNSSSDGTLNFIQENFPEITILPQKSNLGFGAANNIGISHALNNGADYVLLLNQDAYLKDDTVAELIKAHKMNPKFGILSPIHLNGTGDKLDKNFSKYLTGHGKLKTDELSQVLSQPIHELSFINAAAWLLPRKTLEIIGGFDPIFFHTGEDVNYCQRVLYHNLKIGVVPEAYILHDREFRTKKKPMKNKEKLAHLELALKQKWADINFDIEENLRKKREWIRGDIIKSMLSLKLNEGLHQLNRYLLINSVLKEVRNSRKINKEVGLHYLSTKIR
ncbi:glycosyltransferase family 2 protein [Aegicerativicinus sediminis]|uniref:glycosyltransferase family 2 protein n=1 Tax=Aegicerativicinus sediminis TaxID=2893202 RepID=UPI001E61B9E2|nr:glycosyltransferase family 2 protein [Aegicerativicinus sediminis]